jgi:hypothetical protein
MHAAGLGIRQVSDTPTVGWAKLRRTAVPSVSRLRVQIRYFDSQVTFDAEVHSLVVVSHQYPP